MLEIEHLVFGGCGVRNAAYAGGLLALEERGVSSKVRGVAGTSAGSIIAVLAACRYSPQEIRDAVFELDFGRLTDEGLLAGARNLFEDFGWHAASYLEERLDQLIAKKTGRSRTTFEQLRQWGGLDLRIVGTNLSRRKARVFPDETTAGLSIVEAVRISISIPLFFEAKRLDGDVYVDGGVLWNFPIEVFDLPGRINEKALGLLVQERTMPEPWTIDGPHTYASALFATLLRAQDTDLVMSPTERSRAIIIDDLGISPVEFDITRAQKEALVQSGYDATQRFLKERTL